MVRAALTAEAYPRTARIEFKRFGSAGIANCACTELTSGGDTEPGDSNAAHVSKKKGGVGNARRPRACVSGRDTPDASGARADPSAERSVRQRCRQPEAPQRKTPRVPAFAGQSCPGQSRDPAIDHRDTRHSRRALPPKRGLVPGGWPSRARSSRPVSGNSAKSRATKRPESGPPCGGRTARHHAPIRGDRPAVGDGPAPLSRSGTAPTRLAHPNPRRPRARLGRNEARPGSILFSTGKRMAQYFRGPQQGIQIIAKKTVNKSCGFSQSLHRFSPVYAHERSASPRWHALGPARAAEAPSVDSCRRPA